MRIFCRKSFSHGSGRWNKTMSKKNNLKKNTKQTDGETDNYRETEEREDDIKIENMKNGETDMTIKERNTTI